MSYIHYGRIGDIWKHLPLCNFLINEKPRYYIETNSAFPIYPLTHSAERDYGIYTFLNNSKNSEILLNSVFYKTLTSYNENLIDINKYLGSPGLAMNILQHNAEKYIFCDIDEESLNSINEYASKINLKNKVQIYKNDSLKTIYSQLDEYSSLDFIHIDPYMIFEENDEGKTFFNLFLDATKKGMKAMLWYGYENNYQKKCLYNMMKEKFVFSGIKYNNVISIELFLPSLQENEIIVNPGVVGCGVVISNLSQKSIGEFDILSDELVKIYQDSIIYGKFSGKFKKEKFIL